MKTFLKALLRRQQQVLLHSDASFTMQMLGACYIGWGAVLLWMLPGLFVRSHSFDAMSQFATQEVWGAAFMVTGTMKIVGSALQGAWVGTEGSSRARIAVTGIQATGALMGTFIWTFLAFMFSRVPGAATGMVIYTVFAIASVLRSPLPRPRLLATV